MSGRYAYLVGAGAVVLSVLAAGCGSPPLAGLPGPSCTDGDLRSAKTPLDLACLGALRPETACAQATLGDWGLAAMRVTGRVDARICESRTPRLAAPRTIVDALLASFNCRNPPDQNSSGAFSTQCDAGGYASFGELSEYMPPRWYLQIATNAGAVRAELHSPERALVEVPIALLSTEATTGFFCKHRLGAPFAGTVTYDVDVYRSSFDQFSMKLRGAGLCTNPPNSQGRHKTADHDIPDGVARALAGDPGQKQSAENRLRSLYAFGWSILRGIPMNVRVGPSQCVKHPLDVLMENIHDEAVAFSND